MEDLLPMTINTNSFSFNIQWLDSFKITTLGQHVTSTMFYRENMLLLVKSGPVNKDKHFIRQQLQGKTQVDQLSL